MIQPNDTPVGTMSMDQPDHRTLVVHGMALVHEMSLATVKTGAELADLHTH